MPAKPNNPYSNAAGAYGDNAQKNATHQSELEARVLLKSAKILQDLQANWDNVNLEILEESLKYNRQIWMLFYDTALENKENDRPDDLRSNIVNLANFIFKREVEIMGSPEKQKLDILININREIAAGLMEQVKNNAANEPSPSSSEEPTENSGQSTIA